MKYIPHHTAISVRDINKSLDFYKTLGYEEVHRYNEPNGSLELVHLKLVGSFLGIFAYKKNEGKPPLQMPSWTTSSKWSYT